jgi:transposase InsO family protein
MHSHPNARLTQKSRLRLVNQHLQDRRPLAELAAEAGISFRCGYKWLARYRSGGAASLADRRSVRRTQRRTLDPQQQQQAVELRHQRLHLRHIARMLGAPFSTVARALNRLVLGRIRNLEPKPPVLRYERDHPVDLIHIDVKKLARFRKVGHRITGSRQQGRSAGFGYDRLHVAIDDATRLAYVEVLADEQQATAIDFLSQAVAWFNGQGVECRQVMSDNGPAYVSRCFDKACKALGLKHIRTRPYTPRTNGKAEGSSRPSAGNRPTGCRSRTQRNATSGCPATCRSITGSGSTLPSATGHLSSGLTSCSADQRGETQQLAECAETFKQTMGHESQ